MSSPVHTLSGAEIDKFLDEQRTGVLSMASDDRGYGVPMSYTYEAASAEVYLRLGYGPDSTKRAFLEDSEEVTFVVYDETIEGWVSVLVRGPLEELSDVTELRGRHPRGGSDSSVEQVVTNLDIPFFQVFEGDVDVNFVVGRLDARDITGVVESRD